MNTYRKIGVGVLLAGLWAISTSADDRTLRVSIYGFENSGSPFSPPISVTSIIGVSAGSSTNQNPSSISFYVEYSDDLSQWTPLHSAFNLNDTNTETTVVSTLTEGLTAFFYDPNALTSSHRFYRAVESPQ